MASRLRGMVILSSTIIPRTQRLLETGVIKKRPVWLDVVEAYPPLPPPPVPPSLQKGKYPQIVYPEDEEDSIVFAPKVRGLPSNVTSLFESYSLVEVERWKSDRFKDVLEEEQMEMKKEEAEKEKDMSNLGADEHEDRKAWLKHVDYDIDIASNNTKEAAPEVKSVKDAVKYNMDKSIVDLANLLKELEKE